ncbi:MAG: pentapeptide repeat-containing protein [Pseudonocardiaceae bacterium]
MQRETFGAATLIATLVAVGVVLVATSDSSTPWSNLGQALVSGGMVGGVFVFIESSLAQAAERRGQQDNLLRQITLTEKLVGVELDGRVLRDLYLPNKNLTAARLRGTDFSRSVLLFGDFRHADATGALLCGADLGGSTLQRATLTNASARGDCFLDADLTAAMLTGCDLRDADLCFRGTAGGRSALRRPSRRPGHAS